MTIQSLHCRPRGQNRGKALWSLTAHMQAASDHLWHDSSIYHIYAMESLKLSDFLSISRSGQSLLSDPSHRFIFFSRLMELDEKDSSMSVHLRKLREALISSRDKTRFCIDIYAMSLWVALHQENLEELYKCACFLMSEFDEADYNKLIARPCPQIFQKFPSFYEKYKELSWSKLNHWFILIDLSLTLRTGKQLGISRDFSSKYLHGSFSIYFDLITSVNINNFTRFWRIFHNIGSNEQAIVKLGMAQIRRNFWITISNSYYKLQMDILKSWLYIETRGELVKYLESQGHPQNKICFEESNIYFKKSRKK